MDRRGFLAAGSCAAWVGELGGASRVPSTPERGGRMHLGTQQGPPTAEMFDYFRRHGVEGICASPPATGKRGAFTADDLSRLREQCERHGLVLEMVALPFLGSSHIDHERRGAILLGEEPQRQRDLEDIQQMIAACSKAGVPALKYNLSLLGVLRTASTAGRGGARYSTWKLAEARPSAPSTRAGHVGAERFWERITYFLERIIPVCNEHKIRAACHPHDPGVPPEGFQGVVRVLGTPEGLERLLGIQESPYHGLNFCVGTVAEMLRNPAREIHDVIRRFGRRGKIFNVHFRNIRGRRDQFQEVYPDEGDLDMLEVARTLDAVGYRGMLMPDHAPSHGNDPGGLEGFAFAYGYIKGILQAVQGK